MYLRELRLQNIKCFEDLELKFYDDDGKIIKWTVLLGENGTGKTTVLRAIALQLSHSREAYNFLKVVHPMVRYGSSDDAFTEAKLKFSNCLEETYRKQYVIDQDSSGPSYTAFSGSNERDIDKIFKKENGHDHFLCAYGSIRYYPSAESVPAKEQNPREQRIKSLFLEDVPIPSLDEYLRVLDYDLYRAREKDPQAKSSEFDKATEMISGLLPDVKFKMIDDDRVPIFNTPYGDHPLSALSRGYQDVLAWGMDLMIQLIQAFPDSPDPLKEEGVVLVEDIGLYLHPVWQQTVVEFIRKHFPNLQFIVTTHSPLLAQSFGRNEVVVLNEVKHRGKASTVMAERLNLAPKGLTADQILTSPLFGLSSIRGPELQRQKKRYLRLKTKAAKGKLSAFEKKSYERLRQQLDDWGEGPGRSYQDLKEALRVEELLKRLGREELMDRPSLAAFGGKQGKRSGKKGGNT